MTVHYLTPTEGRDNPPSDQTARELVFLAGSDRRLLPDDDVFDHAAVELAANGIRQVKLTMPERLAAATRILASGGSVHSVCLRLGLPADTEDKWKQLQRRAMSVISALVILGLVVSVLASERDTTERYQAHHHHIVRVSRMHKEESRDEEDKKAA